MMSVREYSIKRLPGWAVLALACVAVVYAVTQHIDGIMHLPNALFWGYGWLYWIAIGLTVVIATITLIAKEDFTTGVWAFLVMFVANVSAFLGAQLISNLWLPRLWHYSPSSPDSNFSLDGVLRAIFMYSPHIVIGTVLIASIIFISYRYSEEYEIIPIDILWSFLTALITAVGSLLAIALVLLVVWIIVWIVVLIIAIVWGIIQFIIGIIGVLIVLALIGCCG
ncbi:MAG: hypothetical protein LBC82_01820 [Oscillospiraceae bacterium]|jgi:hypothetical protein|nr:hypothetical protein [Oscillospiraceae bacterium]